MCSFGELLSISCTTDLMPFRESISPSICCSNDLGQEESKCMKMCMQQPVNNSITENERMELQMGFVAKQRCTDSQVLIRGYMKGRGVGRMQTLLLLRWCQQIRFWEMLGNTLFCSWFGLLDIPGHLKSKQQPWGYSESGGRKTRRKQCPRLSIHTKMPFAALLSDACLFLN